MCIKTNFLNWHAHVKAAVREATGEDISLSTAWKTAGPGEAIWDTTDAPGETGFSCEGVTKLKFWSSPQPVTGWRPLQSFSLGHPAALISAWHGRRMCRRGGMREDVLKHCMIWPQERSSLQGKLFSNYLSFCSVFCHWLRVMKYTHPWLLVRAEGLPSILKFLKVKCFPHISTLTLRYASCDTLNVVVVVRAMIQLNRCFFKIKQSMHTFIMHPKNMHMQI